MSNIGRWMKRESLSDHMIQGYLMPRELTTSHCPNASRGLSAALAGVMSHQKGLLLLENLSCLHVSGCPASSLYLLPQQPEGAFQTSSQNVTRLSWLLVSLKIMSRLFNQKSRSSTIWAHVQPILVLYSSHTGPLTVHSFIPQFIECQLVCCSRYLGYGHFMSLWTLGTCAVMGLKNIKSYFTAVLV